MAQRTCTLTFKSSDASTHVITLAANAPITPHQQIQHVRTEGGFWTGGDPAGVAAGSVWVAWEQVVSVTIS
jgi:hypothetical protein